MSNHNKAKNNDYYMGFYKVHNDAFIPKIGLEFSAGSDLYSLFPCTIPSNHWAEIRTGVALKFVSRVASNSKIHKLKESEERRKKEKEEGKYCVPFQSSCKKSCKILDDASFFLKIRSRSGMALNHNINVVSHHFEELNNEIIVTVVNTGSKEYEMEAGTRFAEAIVHLTTKEKTVGGSVKYKLIGSDKNSILLLKDYNGMGKMPVFLAAEDCSIPPDSSKLVGTGIAVSLPSMSCYMQLQSPPLSPCYSDINVQAGVIDADYRGEVKVLINNRSSGNTLRVRAKQPVAMGVVYNIACPIREIIEIKHPENVKPIDGNMITVINESNLFYKKQKDMGIFSVLRENNFLFTFFMQQDLQLTHNITKICTGVFVELNTFKEQNLIADIMSIKKGIDVMSWEINSDTEEIVLVFKNDYAWKNILKKGERIISVFVVSSLGVACLEKVEELDVKGRGCRGFGSTGMK